MHIRYICQIQNPINIRPIIPSNIIEIKMNVDSTSFSSSLYIYKNKIIPL